MPFDLPEIKYPRITIGHLLEKPIPSTGDSISKKPSCLSQDVIATGSDSHSAGYNALTIQAKEAPNQEVRLTGAFPKWPMAQTAEKSTGHLNTRGGASRKQSSTQAVEAAIAMAEDGKSQKEIYDKLHIAASTLEKRHIGIPPEKLPLKEAIALADLMNAKGESREAIYFATGLKFLFLRNQGYGWTSRKRVSRMAIHEALRMHAAGAEFSQIISATNVSASTLKSHKIYPSMNSSNNRIARRGSSKTHPPLTPRTHLSPPPDDRSAGPLRLQPKPRIQPASAMPGLTGAQ